MDTGMIVVLLLVLLLLLILNYFSISVITDEQQYNNTNSPYKVPQGNCGQTAYGCCPDGVNSKLGFNGNNCPRYNPGPGYSVR